MKYIKSIHVNDKNKPAIYELSSKERQLIPNKEKYVLMSGEMSDHFFKRMNTPEKIIDAINCEIVKWAYSGYFDTIKECELYCRMIKAESMLEKILGRNYRSIDSIRKYFNIIE